MTFEEIVQYLNRRIGLNPSSVGFESLRKIVHNAMLAQDISSAQVYYDLISNDEAALQQLIDAVVIPETSFFRDKQPFLALKENVKAYASSVSEEQPLRVLSIPSSTGEEPYSIAMILLEAGMSPNQFRVHACDISLPLLAAAERGIYPEYSFRGCDSLYKYKYFTRQQDRQYHINEEVKQAVKFFHANIVGDDFLEKVTGRYHVIFCRNLLIYFDRPTKEKALGQLSGLMHDNGLLVVGHADTALLPLLGFKSISQNFSFAYVKQQAELNLPPRPGKISYEQANNVLETLAKARQPVSMSRPASDQHAKSVVAGNEHEEVQCPHQQLADFFAAAQYQQVIALAQQCLEKQAHDAKACHYLGLAEYHQQNFTIAEQILRRAIYLDPNDLQALEYLAKVLTETGDNEAAERYQSRANRLKQRRANTESV